MVLVYDVGFLKHLFGFNTSIFLRVAKMAQHLSRKFITKRTTPFERGLGLKYM